MSRTFEFPLFAPTQITEDPNRSYNYLMCLYSMHDENNEFCAETYWDFYKLMEHLHQEHGINLQSRDDFCYECESQCAPGFFNPNKKVHGLFHFYNAIVYKIVQNQLKKPSVIGLPKFTIVNWLKNTINMQILV